MNAMIKTANEGVKYRNGLEVANKTFSEDPLCIVDIIRTKANTVWMQWTYPFAGFGRSVSIHHSCDIYRSAANRIRIGDFVYLAHDVWLTIPEPGIGVPEAIILENGCKIGRRCMISAKNSVWLEPDVLLGPSVVITDHSHEFSNVDQPVTAQGLTAGGTVRIERNCWIGYGAAIIGASGHLVVGRNSVIGANSVVTRSVPPFCVVGGNPAKILKRYDSSQGKWIRGSGLSDAGQ
jgi:acetyltransferase-like isoleucine patch superfamily enzyme